jgi:LPXTG-motif cell wall-anchored protein
MKKLALTMVLVLVMGLGAIAQEGGGLLRKGGSRGSDDITTPYIPKTFSFEGDVDGTTGNTDTPLGSGVAVLLALGGAYFVAKKRREE